MIKLNCSIIKLSKFFCKKLFFLKITQKILLDGLNKKLDELVAAVNTH
jgi:hypothetical protein